jgi:cyclophilin family peptidyl-prolyl cis-trans isomerase
MKRLLIAFLVLGFAFAPRVEAANPVVVMKTSKGTIKIELNEDKAPTTVKNFLQYVDDKFYDGTVFHRVIPTFMIQGGGFTKDITKASRREEIAEAQKKTRAPIKNESGNGLANKKYTIAMARTMALDSATAQFYINVADNDGTVEDGPNLDKGKYCVFGKVIEGMDVVDKIKNVKTKQLVPGFKDVPVETVVIESVRREKK